MANARSAKGSASAAPLLEAHDNQADEKALRWRPRWLAISAAILALMLPAGFLTHSVTGASSIVASDQSLLYMQRMGPPPALIPLYQLLAADTVGITGPSTGRLISTGLYAGAVNKPATLPSFLDGLSAHFKQLLEEGSSNSDVAFFVAPAQGIDTTSVLVGSSWKQLDGTVVKVDRPADLAAIAVVIPQDDLAKFYVPLPIAERPTADVYLATLLVRRNPVTYVRSAGFSRTSGGVSGGKAWCDLPVAGADAGSPIVYISPSGVLSLLGLAVPSVTPHRCAVIGSWTLAQFVKPVMAANWGR